MGHLGLKSNIFELFQEPLFWFSDIAPDGRHYNKWVKVMVSTFNENFCMHIWLQNQNFLTML